MNVNQFGYNSRSGTSCNYIYDDNDTKLVSLETVKSSVSIFFDDTLLMALCHKVVDVDVSLSGIPVFMSESITHWGNAALQTP